MGFETFANAFNILEHLLFEVSLWDLKLEIGILGFQGLTFEVSLWDLKLRTGDEREVGGAFEVFLWELKLPETFLTENELNKRH